MDLVDQLLEAPEDVKLFLKSEFEKVLINKTKQEAIYGNLFYESREERYEIIMIKINKMVEYL